MSASIKTNLFVLRLKVLLLSDFIMIVVVPMI